MSVTDYMYQRIADCKIICIHCMIHHYNSKTSTPSSSLSHAHSIGQLQAMSLHDRLAAG